MDNKPKAVFFMILSAFAFAIMASMVRLAGDIPVAQKVFFRNLVSLFIALGMLYKHKINVFGKKENQKYLLARSILGVLGVAFYFYAINHLYLADATMLNKLSPFFITVFAYFFLKEKLSKIQIPVLLMVFIGALLVIKPQFSFSMLPALSGAASAICAGAAYTLVRFLKNKEHPSTIVFYFSFVSVVATLPIMLLNIRIPTLPQLIFLLGTGVFAAIGQITITFAYKYAPAAEISIYNYFSIIFAAVIGFFLWGEVSDIFSIIGGLLIILAAAANFRWQDANVSAK